MSARSVDRAVEGFARQQHGAFHRDQALRNGATPGLIRRRLATGAWVRLADSSVYALPSHRPTWQRQCAAATLSVPGSALAGAAAAALHRFPGAARCRVEVATRVPTRPTRTSLTDVHRAAWLEPFVAVDGIGVVTPADCTIQLAGRCGPERLTALVEALALDRRGYLDDLRARCAAVGRARPPGIARLRAALATLDDATAVPPRSELERRLRAVLTTVPGVPPVRWEATPPWFESGEARVDAYVPDWRLVVEADGRRWHARVADFERDRWRDNAAAVHGCAVLRFTWRSLTDDLAACRRLLAAYAARAVGAEPVPWRRAPEPVAVVRPIRQSVQLPLWEVA